MPTKTPRARLPAEMRRIWGGGLIVFIVGCNWRARWGGEGMLAQQSALKQVESGLEDVTMARVEVGWC